VLAELVPDLSRSRIKALILAGHVRRSGAPEADPAAQVKAGESIELTVPPPEPLALEPAPMPLPIVFEDDHLVVVDKPAGLVVHPAAGQSGKTLVAALLAHCEGNLSGIGGKLRPGIVHRLDKDTSGLIVVAKTDAAHHALARDFEERNLERRYTALTWGVPVPPAGRIEGNIGRDPRNRKKMTVVRPPAGKPAVTHYRTVRTLANGAAAVVTCRLETGRTHQIRVHLAHIGHAVIGDPAYGRVTATRRRALSDSALEAARGFQRQALHADRLAIEHPITGQPLNFKSELPSDIKQLLLALE